MRFREHRGTLADSMTTCVELPDRAALVLHCNGLLAAYLTAPEVTYNTLIVEPYHMMADTRIGWPMTYIVRLVGYGVIGFTDGPVNE